MPSKTEQIHKTWYIHTTRYYSPKEKSELLIHAITLIYLKKHYAEENGRQK